MNSEVKVSIDIDKDRLANKYLRILSDKRKKILTLLCCILGLEVVVIASCFIVHYTYTGSSDIRHILRVILCSLISIGLIGIMFNISKLQDNTKIAKSVNDLSLSDRDMVNHYVSVYGYNFENSRVENLLSYISNYYEFEEDCSDDDLVTFVSEFDCSNTTATVSTISRSNYDLMSTLQVASVRSFFNLQYVLDTKDVKVYKTKGVNTLHITDESIELTIYSK